MSPLGKKQNLIEEKILCPRCRTSNFKLFATSKRKQGGFYKCLSCNLSWYQKKKQKGKT